MESPVGKRYEIFVWLLKKICKSPAFNSFCNQMLLVFESKMKSFLEYRSCVTLSAGVSVARIFFEKDFILKLTIKESDSWQNISSLVAQKGIIKVEKLTGLLSGKKLDKVSDFLSYRDNPLSVPIQILCRLSSTNPHTLG